MFQDIKMIETHFPPEGPYNCVNYKILMNLFHLYYELKNTQQKNLNLQ